MTPMQEAAASAREMFITLVGAGFSEGQACQIIGTVMAVTGAQIRGEES